MMAGMSPIPDEDWQPIREYGEPRGSDADWEQAKTRFPIGAVVAGTVLARLPMGIFVGLTDRVIGQVEAIAFDEADALWAEREDIPAVGSSIEAAVIAHTPSQQVRLSMRSEDLANGVR